MHGQRLQSVSDTAFWMAYYRALESARPDALMHDPYAHLLAGERGEQLVQRLTKGRGMTWPILRTVCFDELILHWVTLGIDTVLNLAAGLDARPYRMRLPASLHWIEVDLPEVIAYKEEKLAGVVPVCRLQRIAAHLSQLDLRQALFAQVNVASARVLVLTEGLLTYLRAEEVTSLAIDLYNQSRFAYWVTDLAAPFIVERMKKHLGKDLCAANADMYFAPAEGPEFFRPLGWKLLEFRDFLDEGRRLNREIPMARLGRVIEPIFPWYIRRMRKQWRSGVALMGR
ncbi:MAG TPA: SAM-dependent methyltransferase [Candidatus Angelobacter sp.]|jgi:methyltransferase (TIGR00027 family)|nr:SAM-dependent methyltransferase [Candidatus Angelobacter sp.]